MRPSASSQGSLHLSTLYSYSRMLKAIHRHLQHLRHVVLLPLPRLSIWNNHNGSKFPPTAATTTLAICFLKVSSLKLVEIVHPDGRH
jgi:hypothetical protein